jgi:ribosomal protein S18 acetylase RimI-like enzyme
MTSAGLCEHVSTSDRRVNAVQLTIKGVLLSQKFQTQYLDIDAAVEKMLKEATHNLWQAVEEWEFLLEKQSLLKRVQEQKKLRESKDVVIVPYEDKYLPAFVALNREWITQYFEMEDEDFKVLNNPQEYILKPGGKIFVALFLDEPVGVCALHKIDEQTYEMVKMAVSPKAQGKSIGWLLGKAIVEEAIRLGAYKVTLESNTILKPAIKLYEKLGFKKVASHPSPYKRANIHMELDL